MKRGCVHIGVLAFAALIAGCNWMDMNHRAFSPDGHRLYVSQGTDFWFDVQPEKVDTLGGRKSPALIRLMESEMQKAGLCPSGYVVLSDGGDKGFYSIRGRCK